MSQTIGASNSDYDVYNASLFLIQVCMRYRTIRGLGD